METAINFVLASLATWRVAHMIVYERGPWRIIWKIRQRFEEVEFGALLECVACSSVWIAFFWNVPGTRIVMIALAVSAVVMFLEELYGLLWKREVEEAS